MLKADELDRFLDAFLADADMAAAAEPQAADPDIWKAEPQADGGEMEERQESRGENEGQQESGEKSKAPGAQLTDYWVHEEILPASGKKEKLPRRTVFALLLLAAAVPVTIWIGLRFFGDRRYLAVSLLIAVYSILPFFMIFEGRRPQTRELMTIAVLIAIAVAGRAAFFMTPNFKPVAAVTIVAAVSFGAESGFMVGAVSMLASNMLFGQGPWTPWQMCAMGLIGFVAGLFFQKGWLKAKKSSLCIFGFFTTLLIYGGIVNIASLTMFFHQITPQSLLMVYMSGLPMDLVHAASTFIFLWLAGRPLLEKLERIKVKYGMLRAGSDRESND